MNSLYKGLHAQPHAAVLAEEAAERALELLCWAALSGTSAVVAAAGPVSRDLPPNQGLARKGSGWLYCHQQECLASPWQCIVWSLEGAECEATGVLSITSQVSMRTCFCWWETWKQTIFKICVHFWCVCCIFLGETQFLVLALKFSLYFWFSLWSFQCMHYIVGPACFL